MKTHDLYSFDGRKYMKDDQVVISVNGIGFDENGNVELIKYNESEQMLQIAVKATIQE